MKFIIDIILVLIILVSAFIGYKKGFIKLLLPVITVVLAIYLSSLFAPKVSDFVSKKYIEPAVISSVEQKMNDATEEGNGILLFAAEKIGIDLDIAIDNLVNNNQAAQTFTQNNIMPVLKKPVQSVVTLVLFLALSIVLGILARMFNKIIKASPVGLVNQLGGVCVGAAGGIVFSAMVCVILYLIINVKDNGFLIFTKENLENSYLYNYVIGLLFK